MSSRIYRDIVLYPGEYFVGDETCRISTLLGSCVSITLWHPVMKIGAMSHFLLASRNNRRVSQLDGRYGDEAILLMLNKLVERQVIPEECEAKVFGGGNMFPGREAAASAQVGKKNGDAAKLFLRNLGFTVVSESLFGNGHRKIVFDIATGVVWQRQHEIAMPAVRRPLASTGE